MHLLRHHFGDLAAPGNTIAGNVFPDICCAREITLCDGLTLGTAKFGAKPFREAMPGIECPIEFVHSVRKGISTADHERQHARHAQVAIFDFADLQSNGHHAGGIGAAGQSLKQCSTHKGGCSIEQFLVDRKGITQVLKNCMSTMKIILLQVII